MKNEKILINLKKDRHIINLLGEVCWGFKIKNFEKKFGVKIDAVEKLLERLIKEEEKGRVEVYLNVSDIEIIKNAFVEVKKEIEEREFQTRIGVSLDEIKENPIFYTARE